MSDTYKLLDCRLKRWNRMDPTRFIVYATEETAVAAVFDPRTYESLDHRKWTGPRPLKTLAYNFAYIFDNKGKVLVDKRATNKDESDAFARIIMKAAVEISREAYLKEMDRVIWPPKSNEALRMRTVSSPSTDTMAYRRREQSDFSPTEDFHLDLDNPSSRKASNLSPESKRDELIQKINMMMRQMDSVDLEKLCSYTRRFVGG